MSVPRQRFPQNAMQRPQGQQHRQMQQQITNPNDKQQSKKQPTVPPPKLIKYNSTKWRGEKPKRITAGLPGVLFSEPHEYKLVKGIAGFFFGLLLGVGIYFCVLRRLMLPRFLDYALGGSFMLAFAFGYATSVHVRCILLLILPTFFGKEGRSYIGTFAIAYLMAGPITNMVSNGQEVARAISCSSELGRNLTRERLKLRLQPLSNIMKDLQRQAITIHHTTREAKRGFMPVETEIKGDPKELAEIKERSDKVDKNDAGSKRSEAIEKKYEPKEEDTPGEKMEKHYKKNMDFKCEDTFTLGVRACEETFKDLEKECRKKLKIASVACEAVKLNFLCKLVRVLGQIGLNCDANDATNPGLGEDIDTANKAANAMDSEFDVNLQYKIVSNPEELDRKTPEEISKAVQHELKSRKKWLFFIFSIIKRALTFLFLRVLISAYKYDKKFCSDFRFDNVYLTDYFGRIDVGRVRQRKKNLLPLKKTENKVVAPVKSAKLSKGERAKLVKATIKILVTAMGYGLIMFLDWLLYQAMDLINRHTRISYTQTGTHHIDLVVYGNSTMGHLLRTFLASVTQQHNLNKTTTNYECLPYGTPTANSFMWKILAVFIVQWVLLLVEAYGLRLRKVIAAFFHRKREKRRILFLYNDMLKKRKGFLKHMRHTIKAKAKERKLQAKTGLLFKWLERFKKPKRRCLICDEKEDKTYIQCRTPNCPFGYCRTCYQDIEFNCYACRRDDDWTTTDSSDDLEV